MNLKKVYFGKAYVTRPKHSVFCADSEPDDKYNMMSFLDVIADAGRVETYLITKSEMGAFHDSYLKHIYERLIQ